MEKHPLDGVVFRGPECAQRWATEEIAGWDDTQWGKLADSWNPVGDYWFKVKEGRYAKLVGVYNKDLGRFLLEGDLVPTRLPWNEVTRHDPPFEIAPEPAVPPDKHPLDGVMFKALEKLQWSWWTTEWITKWNNESWAGLAEAWAPEGDYWFKLIGGTRQFKLIRVLDSKCGSFWMEDSAVPVRLDWSTLVRCDPPAAAVATAPEDRMSWRVRSISTETRKALLEGVWGAKPATTVAPATPRCAVCGQPGAIGRGGLCWGCELQYEARVVANSRPAPPVSRDEAIASLGGYPGSYRPLGSIGEAGGRRVWRRR